MKELRVGFSVSRRLWPEYAFVMQILRCTISRLQILALFFLFLPLGHAQQASQPSSSAAPATVSIGTAVVQLTGPWRFHPGDDMAWAQPDFDDTAWATMDLTPPEGSYDPIMGTAGFIPGWTAKGYPKLIGYAWYRLRVNVASASGGAAVPLAIRMPEDVDDAYQVYVNGEQVGEFGRFHQNGVTIISSQPRAFALPAKLRSGPAAIAIRMWMSTDTPFTTQDAGGLHSVPLLGQADSIDSMLQLDWDEIGRTQVVGVLRDLTSALVALLGFVLFWLDRREKAYLWLALVSMAHLLSGLSVLAGYYSAWQPMVLENFLIDVILGPLIFVLWVVFWGSWFGLPEMRRIYYIVWSLVVLLILSVAMLRAPLYGSVVPVSASVWLQPVMEVLKTAFGAVLLWIIVRGIRLRGVEGWLALIPLLMLPVLLYQDEVMTLHLYRNYHVLGVVIGPNFVAINLMLAVISVLMMRRFVSSQREKERLESEMEQARQVQQVLVPEKLPSVPGFAIESEYRPAQQVGGDFFQILPTPDSGILAVIGDVSGKGLPAAMTVSLLVGALRAETRHTQNPAELLAAMNTRMVSRSQGGFTTCLVVRVDANGRAVAANAGHLPPYLNGLEVAIANSLPLGLNANTRYGETAFQLEPGDRLTLMTDGVAEARNAAGELFGFERAAAIAAQPAVAIAEAAQSFGQNDDITVIRLEKSGEARNEAAQAFTAAEAGSTA